ncbi:hypothetical protein B586_13015 [Mycobacterium haemophilum DSM 44634]|nr:hypothetical protein B586_13015 [Mycobacterium haemophilum DSM 44634]
MWTWLEHRANHSRSASKHLVFPATARFPDVCGVNRLCCWSLQDFKLDFVDVGVGGPTCGTAVFAVFPSTSEFDNVF